MRLRYTRRARRHLDAIAEYIAERNPDAARRVGERIRETISLLSDLPYIGREGTLPGTREVIVPGLPYIVVYRIESAARKRLSSLAFIMVLNCGQDKGGHEERHDRRP